MIDLDDVRNQMNLNKKEEFITQKHNYQIWQGSNGRWYTYIPDETRPKGRRQIVSHESLISAIYDCYQSKESQHSMTLEKLYPQWQ